MSNGDSKQNVPAELEQIVAYLDGELSPEDCAEVECRLSADENFRRQLQSIDRTWSALNELPRATVDERFSRTTLAMVVAEADKEVADKTRVMPVLRRRRRVSTVLLATTAAAFGFLVFRLGWDDPNQELLADLPVIQQLDVYRQFQDVEFLRQLDDRFSEQLEQLASESPDFDARLAEMRAIASPKGRAAWLAKLSDEEKQNLRARHNQFHVLPAAAQADLRRLHDQVVANEDAEHLQRTMLLYRQWLDGQPPGRQFELRVSSIDDRLDRIGKQIRSERCDAKFALSDEELRRLEGAIREPVEDLVRFKGRPEWPLQRKMLLLHGKQFDARLHAQFKSEEGRERDWNRGRDDRDGDRRRDDDDRRGRRDRRHDDDHGYEHGNSSLYRAMLEGLPERTTESFQRLPTGAKLAWFRVWVRKIIGLRGEISQQELERFFAEDLDAETREQLLSMPSDEMRDALLSRYMKQPELSGDDDSSADGAGRNSPAFGRGGANGAPNGTESPLPEQLRRGRKL